MNTHETQRPIRMGVQLHQQHVSYPVFADAVKRTEDVGVDMIFDCDHFFPLYGDSDNWHLEGWTLLTAMAMLTSQVEIGRLVTCAAYRNPALLSNMAKTLDHISQGRLILGVGAGILERDFREYGYDFGTPASRLNTLEQTLEGVRQRWMVNEPKPTRPIPILVGGGGEQKTLRLAAQYADMWHGFGDPETPIATRLRYCISGVKS